MKHEQIYMECPFCGSYDVEISWRASSTGGVYVGFAHCKNCGSQGPEVESSKEDIENKIAACWNMRNTFRVKDIYPHYMGDNNKRYFEPVVVSPTWVGPPNSQIFWNTNQT